jgi:hypothetical protein
MPVSGMACINTSQVVVGSTALPQANLVAEYPLTEGYGAYAYNYASPQPGYGRWSGLPRLTTTRPIQTVTSWLRDCKQPERAATSPFPME